MTFILKMLEKQKCCFTNYVALNLSALYQSLSEASAPRRRCPVKQIKSWICRLTNTALPPNSCQVSKDMQERHVWKNASTHGPLRAQKLSELSATGKHRANENKNELNLKDNDSSMSNYLRWIFDDTSSGQLVCQSPSSAFGKEG